MKQRKIKIGHDLRARMDALCDRYGCTLGEIATKALRSFDKHCANVEIWGSTCSEIANATRGSIPITVRTDRPPLEVRAIIDWFILPYEENPPELPPNPSQQALEDERRLQEQQLQLAKKGHTV